eukprot:253200-Pleurochrysis_carterae.AAC.2
MRVKVEARDAYFCAHSSWPRKPRASSPAFRGDREEVRYQKRSTSLAGLFIYSPDHLPLRHSFRCPSTAAITKSRLPI